MTTFIWTWIYGSHNVRTGIYWIIVFVVLWRSILWSSRMSCGDVGFPWGLCHVMPAARYDLMFFWMTSTMSRAKGHLGSERHRAGHDQIAKSWSSVGVPCDLRKKVELRDLPMLPSSDAIAAWQADGVNTIWKNWWEWHGMAQRMPSKSTEWWTFWFLWKVMEGGRSPTEIQQVSTKVAKFCHWMVMMATQTTIRHNQTTIDSSDNDGDEYPWIDKYIDTTIYIYSHHYQIGFIVNNRQ